MLFLQLNEISIPQTYISYRVRHEFTYSLIDNGLGIILLDTDEYDMRVWPIRKS